MFSGLTSCWSRAAIMLPLNAELGWAMWVQGFSLSLWIRINPSLISYSLDENECKTLIILHNDLVILKIK